MNSRKKIALDQNWRFSRGEYAPFQKTEGWGGAKARAFSFGVTAKDFDDSDWRQVNIPHDFVCEGDYTKSSRSDEKMRSIPEMESINSRHFAGGSLEGGVAWYRQRFSLPASCEGQRVYLYFGGAYRNTEVYVNEYYVGSHESGYTSFYFDVTDFLDFQGENLLAVKVDAAGREGWWYEGGGLYRHVWLEICSLVHVAPWGSFVSAVPDLERKEADLTIQTELCSRAFEEEDVRVEYTLLFQGKAVAACSRACVLPAWDHLLLKDQVVLEDIKLWGLSDPNVYQLKTELFVKGQPVDTLITEFGIRDLRFDADKGFFLNGESVKIKGVCCHQDHAGVGIGVPDSVNRYRIEQIKRLGANAYRCAHHQQSEELLTACDHAGVLVFAETRRMSSAEEDLEALRTLIRRDRNHPSVFLWGIGNEEVFSQDRPETVRTTRTLMAELKKLDNTRPVTAAVVCWNGKERFDTAEGYVAVTKNLDVMGFNYCRSAWEDYHRRVPSQPILITEDTTNSGTRGCYATDVSTGQYYILDEKNEEKCGPGAVKKGIGEAEWKYIAEHDAIAGAFLWTGFDYRGEPTPMPYPAVYSQFGILDYCGFPKDNAYYYKSWWQEKPVLHLFPHWNFRDKVGQIVPVHCYSNLDAVELFVNGKSFGSKTMPGYGYLSWEDVVYEPGTLSAVGYRDGKAVLRECVETTGEAAVIHAAAAWPASGEDRVGIINVDLRDEKGRFVPTADVLLQFAVEGGRLLGIGNGNPGSHESEKLPVHRAFCGTCQAIVQVEAKSCLVRVTSDGLCGASVTLSTAED